MSIGGPEQVHKIVDDLIVQSLSEIPINSFGAKLRYALSEWRDFFRLAKSEKIRRRAKKLEGYFPLESETAVGSKAPDPKEFYHVYDPAKLPPRLSQVTRPVFSRCLDISREIVEELYNRRLLHQPVNFPMVGQHLLRIVRYPTSSVAISAAPHTDITLFTLSLISDRPGLVLTDPTGTQLYPLLDSSRIVVFAGDMLETTSSGTIQSIKHHVASYNLERHSMQFFANPPDETLLSHGITAAHALSERLREMETDAI